MRHFVWKCWNILPLLSLPLAFATLILLLFDLFVYDSFDCPFVRSFVYPCTYVCICLFVRTRRPARIRSHPLVHSFIAMRDCPLLFSSCNLCSPPPPASLPLSCARWHSPRHESRIRGFPRERAITLLRSYAWISSSSLRFLRAIEGGFGEICSGQISPKVIREIKKKKVLSNFYVSCKNLKVRFSVSADNHISLQR